MEIFLIALLTIIAGGVGTLTGFGTSTIMVPVLLLFFPLAPTLLFVGIIHLFSSLWKITLFREGVRWRLIFLFGIPGAVFSFIGARLVFAVSEILLSQILGGFLVTYVLFLFLKPQFQFKQNSFMSMAGGVLSGFFAGIFGIGGVIHAAFLSAFYLPKAVYIATAGAISLVVDTSRIGMYLSEGVMLPTYLAWGLVIFIPASFVGAYGAKRIIDHVSQEQFRKVAAVFLFVVGVKLLIFP